MITRHRKLAIATVAALIPAMMLTGGSGASASPPVAVPEAPIPDEPGAVIAPSLAAASGRVQVVVRLARPSLAATVAEGATADGTLPSASSQDATIAAVNGDQNAVAAAAGNLGAAEIGRVDTALNALVLDIDAASIDALALVPGVVSVNPLRTYSNNANPTDSGSLEQAAAYLEADAVRAAGFDGTGVRVAVLDSGIDYTHADLGGPGTPEFYEQCYGDVNDPSIAGPKDVAVAAPCDAYFGPNAPKVKGGYDFVGDDWPNSPEVGDPNPLDYEGHGTHVADIIGGNGPNHQGLAPGVSLYGVKVCSAVATSCSGLALLQATDWVLDPNGDGDMSDAMDLINLSLGSDYGQDEDDLSFALDNVVRAGVVVVASAGNGGDRSFKVGSPSIAPRVISVAQTALPDEQSFVIAVTSPAGVPGLTDNQIKLTVLQPWGGAIPASPGLVGDLARPSGSVLGCAVGDFGAANAGRIALVNRGSCAISIKASNAQAAGATGMILVNNTGGAPGAFSYGGGGTITIPVLSVSQPAGNALGAALAGGPVSVQVDPAIAVSLAGTMVASSSRGPSIDGIRVKPDIGAPGAWLSAEVGSGDGQTNFGGTSGAAPTVSGVAALLLQQFPKEKPILIKTRLLNGAYPFVSTPDLEGNLYPTPISRIGAGEVRALASSTSTFRLKSGEQGGGGLALGSVHTATNVTITKKVTVQNLLNVPQQVNVVLNFREAADQALGAITMTGGGMVNVPAKASVTVNLNFTVIAANLPDWLLAGQAGALGGDGTVLNGPELDGYLTASVASGETQHVGWHLLPHKSANVNAPGSVNLKRVQQALIPLTNSSTVADGGVSVYSLTGTSPKLPKPAAGAPGSPGSNVAQVDLRNVGVRTFAADDVVQFAINSENRRPTPLYPAGYEVDVDSNRDGTVDYYVFQQELGGFGASGQSVVYVQDATTNAASAYYYSDADYDSANIVFSAPLGALGLVAGQSFDFSVYAFDNYFSGLATDAIEGMTYTVDTPKFAFSSTDVVVPRNGVGSVTITKTGSVAPSTELGALFLFDNAASRREAAAVIVKQ